jgi:hypothetical protein
MDNQDQELIEAPPETDLTAHQLERVEKYKEAGLPGINSVSEHQTYKMFDMYLSGKTYTQISRITGVNKDIVLYLSHKMDWAILKNEYLMDMQRDLDKRLNETKIVSQAMLADMIHFYKAKIGKKIDRFLSTGDESAADSINPKDIDKYLKTVEMLHKFTEERGSKGGKSPAVGLNVGDGVTIKKVGENEVEITPKQKVVSDMLKQFANLRRDEENKFKKSDKHDKDEHGTKKGENDEV